MTDFTISLAGIPIHVAALHSETRDYCEEYLCDQKPRISFELTAADIEYEREHAVRRDIASGIIPVAHSDHYLETLALLRKTARAILDYDVLLFHGAVVVVEGRAYLFTAPSGTGKTTHIRLWLDRFPGAYVLNGDKPFLKVEADGRVLACGAPWRGKERYGRNEILPLEAVCLLERAIENRIESVSLKDALNVLIQQTHMPSDSTATLKTLRLIEKIGQGTRLYRLECNMEPDAARVSSRAMIGGLS